MIAASSGSRLWTAGNASAHAVGGVATVISIKKGIQALLNGLVTGTGKACCQIRGK